uniref:Uncharacterized protein n=1 Tax=Oscillatoriales cyanobacterium SpSt-418 TaxID=2282169 RepID=A0A7C3PFN4_9CYAN
MSLRSERYTEIYPREDFSEYVAHLQLHMALQARKLVPSFVSTVDSRQELLHKTQAEFEKLVSRQPQ